MDKITLDRIQLLHPMVRAEALAIHQDICAALTGRAICRFTQTLRTFEEQNQLYAQGRTKPGAKITAAKGGQSFHNYGLAIDIALIIDGKQASWDTVKDWDGDLVSDWMEIVKIFTSYGWQWGLLNSKGQRYDLPHFQKTFGNSWQTLLSKYNSGNFIPGTKYVNL